MEPLQLIILAVTALLGGYAGNNVAKSKFSSKTETSQSKAEKILDKADEEAQIILEKAGHNLELLKNKIANQNKEKEQREASIQKRIELQEEKLQKRQSKVDEKQQILDKIDAATKDFAHQYDTNNHEIEKGLEKKAAISSDKAKQHVMEAIDKSFASFSEGYATKKEMLIKNRAHREAVELLEGALQKYSEPSSVDRLERTVYLPRLSDKEKLIGKDFENLRYIEQKTEADIIFDDAPKHVTVSCFQLVKQEIARITVMNLIGARNVNPQIIDEAYQAAVEEMDDILLKVGTEAANHLGLENRDPELLKIIGRLKYRTSYGQNILYHSFEIAYFCAMLAAEIGCDVETAKLAGFFHDIGKAIDQEDGRSHDLLSKEILERFNYPWEVVHAAYAHHDAVPQETPEAHLVIAADKLSAGRPGARTETAEQYVERIEGLEKIGNEPEGIRKAYAVSAGRELRVFIDENMRQDTDMPDLAKSMARQIEESLVYPGKIKVNIIRTLKVTDFANKKAKKKSSSKS